MRRGFSPYSMLMKNNYFKRSGDNFGIEFPEASEDQVEHAGNANAEDWERVYDKLFHQFGQ